jgi:hypothetical protein
MTARAAPEVPQEPSNSLKAAAPSHAATRNTPEISAPMLDVHARHQSVHTWKDFLVHIAAITIGLLIALGLEATVEWFHHRHQARQALELLTQEIDQNRILLERDIRMGDRGERNHRAALAVLHRLRSGTLKPDDRLVFVRRYDRLRSSAWKVVHESNAAAYIPYDLMAQFGEIYEIQQDLNETATAVYAELQKATAVLNTEQDNQNRNEEDRMEREADDAIAQRRVAASATDEAENAVSLRLSGNPDLSRLTPGQIDRLEQGFQQAITDDRRLHRTFVYLDDLYGALAK